MNSNRGAEVAAPESEVDPLSMVRQASGGPEGLARAADSPLLAAGGRRVVRSLIYLAALLSGASTLVYELVWMRTLSLAVGATWPAISVVLAGFMAGLGAGAVLGGRLSDRRSNPLALYVIVELAVAAVAAVFPWASDALSHLVLPGIRLVPGRALLSALVMLPATALMGMTFPLLSTALHRDRTASHVPLLYAVNTVGAALGCIAGGLFLPYVIGVPRTQGLGTVLNFCAAALAALATRRLSPVDRQRAVDLETAPRSQSAGGLLSSSRHLALLMGLAFGSGALIMANEVLWTRSMLQLNNRIYFVLLTGPQEVVTLVLVLILFGNALGSLWCGWLARRPASSHLRALVYTYVLGALSSLLCLEWFAVQVLGLQRYDMPQWPADTAWLRLIPVVPPSILLGATFPLLARLYSGELSGHGRRMGQVWLANTAGAVLGSLLCGGLLIPSIGAGKGLVLSAALGLVLAAVAMTLTGVRLRELLLLAAGASALLVTALMVPLGPGQWYRLRYGPKSVVASWEGWESTTIVADTPEGRTMATNGWIITPHQGYVERARMIQSRMPDAKRVLLVGFGSGTFARQFLQNPALEKLTVVEIEPEQYRAARYFDASSIFRDPKLKIVADDAVHFISQTSDRYDMIVIDSWGPETSPQIYTREFHERALPRLTDHGAIFVKLSPLTGKSLRWVTDAVRCVYPYAYAGIPPAQANTLVGTRDPANGQGMISLPAPGAAPCQPLEHLHPRRLTVDVLRKADNRPQVPKY